MLQNAYFLAKIGADTAENEQHFAEILPKTGKGRSRASAARRRRAGRKDFYPLLHRFQPLTARAGRKRIY